MNPIWLSLCLKYLVFLPVVTLSAALEGNRHEIHQFPPGRGSRYQTVLASAGKSFCRSALRAGEGQGRVGKDLLVGRYGHWCRDLPCAWKTGSGGQCCWLLLPTTVRLGFRAAGEQERVYKARMKEVNYYLLGTHRVWTLLSAMDALVQGKGVWDGTSSTRRRLLQTSTVPLLSLLLFTPFPILVLPGRSLSSSLPVLQKADREEKTPWLLYIVESWPGPQAGNSPWMKDALSLRVVHLAAAQGAVSGSLMRSLPKR